MTTTTVSRGLCFLMLLGLSLSPGRAWGQEKSEPASSIPTQVLHDDLLDHMVGAWRLDGRFEGQPVNHSVEVAWALNHQFIQIHEKDLSSPRPGAPVYEALVYIGYEPARGRYVAHWLDVFGNGSPTLGYGKRTGSAIQFAFPYPGQLWITTFRWNAQSNRWTWLMRTKDKQGRWVHTADMTLSRVAGK